MCLKNKANALWIQQVGEYKEKMRRKTWLEARNRECAGAWAILGGGGLARKRSSTGSVLIGSNRVGCFAM